MGWELGNHWMTMDGGGESAVDEPQAISGGGDMIYSSLCCDRRGQGMNLSEAANHWPTQRTGSRLRRNPG